VPYVSGRFRQHLLAVVIRPAQEYGMRHHRADVYARGTGSDGLQTLDLANTDHECGPRQPRSQHRDETLASGEQHSITGTLGE
jgi:hypothetical protein